MTGSAAPVAREATAFELVIIVVGRSLVDSGDFRQMVVKVSASPMPDKLSLVPFGIECREVEGRGDTMLFDRQRFVLAVHKALKEHDKDKDKVVDSGGHNIAIDCDQELEQFADRILELME